MSDKQIAATLRTAVKQGLIVGWYRPAPSSWVINTQVNGARVYTPAEVHKYCLMLDRACTGPTAEPTQPSPELGTSSSTPS